MLLRLRATSIYIARLYTAWIWKAFCVCKFNLFRSSELNFSCEASMRKWRSLGCTTSWRVLHFMQKFLFGSSPNSYMSSEEAIYRNGRLGWGLLCAYKRTKCTREQRQVDFSNCLVSSKLTFQIEVKRFPFQQRKCFPGALFSIFWENQSKVQVYNFLPLRDQTTEWEDQCTPLLLYRANWYFLKQLRLKPLTNISLLTPKTLLCKCEFGSKFPFWSQPHFWDLYGSPGFQPVVTENFNFIAFLARLWRNSNGYFACPQNRCKISRKCTFLYECTWNTNNWGEKTIFANNLE